MIKLAIRKILFGRTISGGYLGRHGGGKISGLEIMRTGQNIMLSPITSRGEAAVSCFIEIPADKLKEVIAILSEYV